MDYKKEYEKWLSGDCFDLKTKEELWEIAGDDREIEERFYKSLEFGTGGLRGILGAGTNRMNIYTVRAATQGLANFILKQGDEGKDMGVVIAHDSRRLSPEFALNAALVLNGNGIKAYLFDELRPTPELSFAVRKLGCIAGIVITASHNPPEYNGYKAYWSDGAQIPYPKDEQIIDEVSLITDFATIKVADKNEMLKSGMLTILEHTIDDEFVACVKGQSINPDVIKSVADDFKIVYTPLHGTGNKPVRRVLADVGFKNVFVVPEQEMPDSNFSTVSYPNPEDPKAFTLALTLAGEVDADIIIATDPDADRMGAVVKDKGEYVFLTGNMTGVLLAEYVLSQRKAKNTLPENAAVISTIVSSNITQEIAKAYNAAYCEVLTGFKYIGERIKQFEDTGSNSFVFGFEESYGYLAGTYARDKDAVVATLLMCEAAAYYKTREMTLCDGLREIYKKYGYYSENTQSITMKGIDGIASIKKIMAGLRNNPPAKVNGLDVLEFRDYKAQEVTDLKTGVKSPTGLPVSDVLYFVLSDESWFCVRPSGTEPKIKIYFGVKGKTQQEADKKLTSLMEAAMETVNGI